MTRQSNDCPFCGCKDAMHQSDLCPQCGKDLEHIRDGIFDDPEGQH